MQSISSMIKSRRENPRESLQAFMKMRPEQREARQRARDQGELPDDNWHIHANRTDTRWSKGPADTPSLDIDSLGNVSNQWGSGFHSVPSWDPVGGVAQVSRENSGQAPHSTGFLDHNGAGGQYNEYRGYSDTGWKVKFDPAHHHVLRSVADYKDWIDKYPEMHPMKDENGKLRHWRGPDWNAMTNAGVYSVEFPKSLWDEFGRMNPEQKQAFRDAGQTQPGAFCGEPQSVLFHRGAVKDTQPWKGTPVEPLGNDAWRRYKFPNKRGQPSSMGELIDDIKEARARGEDTSKIAAKIRRLYPPKPVSKETQEERVQLLKELNEMFGR